MGRQEPAGPHGALALVDGHSGASPFVERTEHPGKLWLVPLNLKNMFASPRGHLGVRTGLQISCQYWDDSELAVMGEKGLEERQLVMVFSKCQPLCGVATMAVVLTAVVCLGRP